ncbi:MAG TPA: hypothetical protein VIQ74_10280 [Gemmatimonadaceae bacterium]
MILNSIVTASHESKRLLATAGAALGIALSIVACGGGGGGTGVSGPPENIDLDTRISAATTTAQSSTNACAPIQPFYWEVGDETGRLASGSVPSNGGNPTYTSTTLMSIASASKWLYGAYVVQLRQGQLSDSDITFLTFRSGYTHFTRCLPTQTVDECVAYDNNGVHSDATDGLFSYGGGHMEKHASLIGLGPQDNAGLADAIRSQLGSDLTPLVYIQPQLAGGVVTNADTYAKFLRKILSGALSMKAALGTHAVCTNPATCAQAHNAPVPESESYHYSIGHWVEDDPTNGDGAFSSAGAFGFYPWIDASKSWYGIVARKDTTGTSDPGDPDTGGHGFDSAQCGQLIRSAWIHGVP